jgi:hypothetical protein
MGFISCTFDIPKHQKRKNQMPVSKFQMKHKFYSIMECITPITIIMAPDRVFGSCRMEIEPIFWSKFRYLDRFLRRLVMIY